MRWPLRTTCRGGLEVLLPPAVDGQLEAAMMRADNTRLQHAAIVIHPSLLSGGYTYTCTHKAAVISADIQQFVGH